MAANLSSTTPAAPAGSVNATFQYDGSGNVSGYVPNGAFVLLEEHTASTSTELDFTTGITSAYDEYIIEIVDLLPANGGNTSFIYLQFSQDGGVTYDSSANYAYAVQYEYPPTGTGATCNASDTQFLVAGTNVSSGTMGASGRLTLYNPLSTTHSKGIISNIVYFNDDINEILTWHGGGRYKPTPAVNAFRVYSPIGNLTSGSVRMYGVAH